MDFCKLGFEESTFHHIPMNMASKQLVAERLPAQLYEWYLTGSGIEIAYLVIRKDVLGILTISEFFDSIFEPIFILESAQQFLDWLQAKGRILHLTLKKEPFEVMITGEKDREFREKSDWITSRLFDRKGQKNYNYVKFTNGYGNDRPFFYAEFKGFDTVFGYQQTYSNGFCISTRDEMYMIRLGKILKHG